MGPSQSFSSPTHTHTQTDRQHFNMRSVPDRVAYRSTISPRSFSILTAGGKELMEFGIEYGVRGAGGRLVVGPGDWVGGDDAWTDRLCKGDFVCMARASSPPSPFGLVAGWLLSQLIWTCFLGRSQLSSRRVAAKPSRAKPSERANAPLMCCSRLDSTRLDSTHAPTCPNFELLSPLHCRRSSF